MKADFLTCVCVCACVCVCVCAWMWDLCVCVHGCGTWCVHLCACAGRKRRAGRLHVQVGVHGQQRRGVHCRLDGYPRGERPRARAAARLAAARAAYATRNRLLATMLALCVRGPVAARLCLTADGALCAGLAPQDASKCWFSQWVPSRVNTAGHPPAPCASMQTQTLSRPFASWPACLPRLRQPCASDGLV